MKLRGQFCFPTDSSVSGYSEVAEKKACSLKVMRRELPVVLRVLDRPIDLDAFAYCTHREAYAWLRTSGRDTRRRQLTRKFVPVLIADTYGQLFSYLSLSRRCFLHRWMNRSIARSKGSIAHRDRYIRFRCTRRC